MEVRGTPWSILAGCFLLSVGVNAFVIAPSTIAPLFVDRFGVPEAAVGNIVSAAILGEVLVQPPAGYVLDRYDNRWLVVPAVIGFVAVILASQAVGAFGPFLFLRLLGGVFTGLLFTVGANVVGHVFDADRLSLATGVYLASPPVAFAVSHATSPLIGAAFGPLRVFLLHVLLTVLGLGLFWFGATDPVRQSGRPTTAEYASALRDRRVVLVALSAAAMYGLYIFLNTWVPTYGATEFSLSLSVAGFVTALVPLVGVLARPSGGWLSGRLGGRRPVLAGGLLAALVCLAAIPFAGRFRVFLVLIVGAAFSVQLGTGVYYTLIRELATAGTEGASLTVLTTITYFGAFAGPIVGGWLIARYSWTVAFTAFAVLGVCGTVVLVPLNEPGAAFGTD